MDGANWGELGRLGLGDDITRLVPTAVRGALHGKSVVGASAGQNHSAVVTQAGELYTWGGEEFGILGHSEGTHMHSPKVVEALLGKRVVGVSAAGAWAAGAYTYLPLSST